MKQVKIYAKGASSDFKAIAVVDNVARFSEQDIPCVVRLNDVDLPMHRLTSRVELSVQAGLHSLTTSNAYSEIGSMVSHAEGLGRFGISLFVQQDKLVFVNGNPVQVDISIEASDDDAVNYVPIVQENESVVIDGKNVRFSLAPVSQ